MDLKTKQALLLMIESKVNDIRLSNTSWMDRFTKLEAGIKDEINHKIVIQNTEDNELEKIKLEI